MANHALAVLESALRDRKLDRGRSRYVRGRLLQPWHPFRKRSVLPESLRAELTSRFADSDARLAAWWGRTPSWCR